MSNPSCTVGGTFLDRVIPSSTSSSIPLSNNESKDLLLSAMLTNSNDVTGLQDIPNFNTIGLAAKHDMSLTSQPSTIQGNRFNGGVQQQVSRVVGGEVSTLDNVNNVSSTRAVSVRSQTSVNPSQVMSSFHASPIVMGGLLSSMKARQVEMDREHEEAMRKAKVRSDRKIEEEWRRVEGRGGQEGEIEEEVRGEGGETGGGA